MTKDASTGSIRSIASSRSGTLSRPPPPPKPTHLSSSFTGTCNSVALRHYIQTHTTGGSFSTHSSSTPTISRAHLGHGYDSSTIDHFVDAFDAQIDHTEQSQSASTTKPPIRGRTHTAPSVSQLFDARSENSDASNSATRLIRNEPIPIDGSGASRVGNLRNMFEAAIPSTSTHHPLSRHNTGTRNKPRISNQVRMLQAQITGDRFNGLAGAFNLADARSSIIVDKEHGNHQRTETQHSQDDSIYRTANQDLLVDALKMDAVVMPPSPYTDTLKTTLSGSFPSSSHSLGGHVTEVSSKMDNDATISRSTSTKAGLTFSNILAVTAQHNRDDSSATIRPSHSNPEVAPCGTLTSSTAPDGTARRRSTRLPSISKKGRLSSIFTASPQSSERSGRVDRNATEISPSPSGISMTSGSASETDSEAERSREPSMLLADDQDISFSRTSHHLRANDGSCFDLDLRASASPTKAATVRRALLQTATGNDAAHVELVRPPSTTEELDEATVDDKHNRHSPAGADMSAANTDLSLARAPSVDVDLKSSEEGVQTCQPIDPAQGITEVSGKALPVSRPGSARMPQPGIGKPARALYDFQGEAAFNELIVRAGQPFEILNEQLAGGWSLGIVWDQDGVPTRGLIPQGWYCYIQDFTRSPAPSQGIAAPPSSDIVGHVIDADGSNLLPAPALPGQSAVEAEKGSDANAVYSQLLTSPSEEKICETTHTVLHRSDGETSPSLPRDEEPAAIEPEAQISVSAFLQTKNEEAQWQQVEMTDTQASSDGTDALEDQTNIHKNIGNAIDGMPSVSTEENPIIWPAEADSHSLTTDTNDELGSNAATEEATNCLAPASKPEPTATTAPDWKGSIFGRKTLNRFASFVKSGAEDYVLSNSVPSEDERSRFLARKVSGGRTAAGTVALTQVAEEDEGATALDKGLQPSGDVCETSATQVVRPEPDTSLADPHHNFVVAGHAGPKWMSKQPPFLVQVHHPEKRTKLNGMQEYTVYYVTSTYPANAVADAGAEEDGSRSCMPYDPLGGPYPPGAQVTVVRRFTQFEWLHQVLVKRYSALVIPPLPEKQYSGRFASDFIETRRADLEMWISRLVRHPVLRCSEPISFFLNCEDEAEWRAKAAMLLRNGDAGGVFAQTWHPDFNFDAHEAAVEADRLEAFLKALEKTINGVGGHNAGKQGLLAAFRAHREGNVASSSTYRDLSYTLLRTLTGAGAGPSDGKDTNVANLGDDVHRMLGPPMGNVGRRSDTGATNEHGAWCWREDCQDCLNLTSALQNTAECLQNVADIYETHARETLLRQHERLKEVSRPHSMAQPLLETHTTTLERYREATGEVDPGCDSAGGSQSENGVGSTTKRALLSPEEAEKQAARCETVINVTLSEMDRIHDERVQDYHAFGRSFLDGEIELYESILEQLKVARLHYDEEYYEREPDFHVLASRYQSELSRPKKPTPPLLMPSAAHGPPGGLRSAAMLISQATGGIGVTRPASLAIESMYDSSSMVSPSRKQAMNEIAKLVESTNTVHANVNSISSSTAVVTSKSFPFQHCNPHDHQVQVQVQDERQRTSSYFSTIWR